MFQNIWRVLISLCFWLKSNKPVDIRNDAAYRRLGSRRSYRLHITAPRKFVFDGVQCSSMSALLEAFKFADEDVQHKVCGLTSKAAEEKGKEKDPEWQQTQMLHWQGKTYPRDSLEYQVLLDSAFRTMYAASKEFRDALRATGTRELVCREGCNDPRQTVLTEGEFCKRLIELRTNLRNMKVKDT